MVVQGRGGEGSGGYECLVNERCDTPPAVFEEQLYAALTQGGNIFRVGVLP